MKNWTGEMGQNKKSSYSLQCSYGKEMVSGEFPYGGRNEW